MNTQPRLYPARVVVIHQVLCWLFGLLTGAGIVGIAWVWSS